MGQKKYILRIFLAVITFTLGVGAANSFRGLAPRHQHHRLVPAFAGNTALANEIMKVETAWHQAQVNADQKTLEHIFAEEFINIDPFGRESDRAEFISFTAYDEPLQQTFQLGRPEIIYASDNQVIIELDKTLSGSGFRTLHFRDIDSFVKRDGRWQLVRSDSAQYPYSFE